MFNNVFRDPDILTAIRKHHIDTLKIFNDNVTEVVEDVEYKVNFSCGGRDMCLVINLGSNFPSEKPILTVNPPVSHPWVTQAGEITSAPGLLNFSVHSDLGRVVQAIVREFELRPPPLPEAVIQGPKPQDNSTTEPPSGPLSPKCLFNTHSPSYVDYGYNSYTYLSNQAMSVIFPELNSLTVLELKELSECPEKLDELINRLPTKQALDRNMDELIDTADQLARNNLEKQPTLVKLQEELQEKMKILQKAKVKYDKYDIEYQKLCEKFNPLQIRESLRNSVIQVEEESEKIAEMFLDGRIDLDSFLLEYVNHRKVSYSQKAKHDKLSQQLLLLHQAGF